MHLSDFVDLAFLVFFIKTTKYLNMVALLGVPLVKDLKSYLNQRFDKGSVDSQLQAAIRDNLYLRTLPCMNSSCFFLNIILILE